MHHRRFDSAGARPRRHGSPTRRTPAAAKDDERMAEARKQFQAGVNLLDDPDGAKYELAYHAFHRAYELSHSAKVLGNIGLCALHLERDGEAIDAYSMYLRDAPDVSDREKVQIQRDLATLSSTAVQLKATVKKPGSGFTLVDNRIQTSGGSIVNSYPFDEKELNLRIRPGHHVFKVVSPSGESSPIEANLSSSAQATYEFTFPVAPPVRDKPAEVVMRSPSYAGPIVLGVAGVVIGGAGAALGLLARDKTKNIEGKCPNDVCPASYDFTSDRDSTKKISTLADAAFVTSGVAVGGALLWYLLTPRAKSVQTGSTGWAPSGFCTADGCAVRFERGF